MTQTAAAPAQTNPGPSATMLTRVALVMGTWVLVTWLIVGLFVWPILPGGWWTLLAAMAASLAPVPVLLRGFKSHAYPSALTRVLILRPFWYVLLLLPLVAIGGIVGAIVGWPLGSAATGGRIAIATLSTLLGLFVLVGYFGSRALVVKPIEITHTRLPPALDGLRIAQLSDIHIGPHTPRGHIRKIVRAVEQAKPDIIVYTGDQVDDYDQDVAHFVRAFGGLKARLGSYAIAGNHDIYAGWEGVKKGMEDAGIRVLVNDAEPLADGAWIAGTGDPAAMQWGVTDPNAPAPDINKTLLKIPEDAFSLVLAHNPALWPGLAKRGASVTLSGHTHHGQLSIPWLNWCLASPFLEHSMGRYERGQSTLYINPGTNFWGLPLRIGAWPEVTIVTLRSHRP